MVNLRVAIIIGTRPEAIKMAPVINILKKNPQIDTLVCVTGQHREMLDQVLETFSIEPDCDLNIMAQGQNLTDIGVALLSGLNKFLNKSKPNLVLVHGDTSTTFFGALSSFYHKIPVAHVEAGLRSHDKMSPWPEEVNRKLTGSIVDMHFAPTQKAVSNLKKEGIPSNKIILTGNTVIDALHTVEKLISINERLKRKLEKKFSFLNSKKRLILLTVHRRENQGTGFENIFNAVKTLSKKYPNVEFLFPVHLSSSVQNSAEQILSNIGNVYLTKPLDYLSFVYILRLSYLILTDSGGIQEEAPTFRKPLLILRNDTEREESIIANVAKLVGVNHDRIVQETSQILESYETYQKMQNGKDLYGDGKACQRILNSIKNFYQ